MNWLHSFRWRVLLGTTLWTLGLIPLMHLLFLVVHGQLRFMPGWAIEIFLVFATLCILAGIWQFRAGLLPFDRLRRQLLGLRDGSGDRIEGTYPTEVQPLVNDLNSLLEHRERIVRRALAKAGDLAHGLKTPLAVLAQEAEQFEAAGQHEIASAINLQVDRMRRQVDYHLTQARATTPGNAPGARCPVLVSVTRARLQRRHPAFRQSPLRRYRRERLAAPEALFRRRPQRRGGRLAHDLRYGPH